MHRAGQAGRGGRGHHSYPALRRPGKELRPCPSSLSTRWPPTSERAISQLSTHEEEQNGRMAGLSAFMSAASYSAGLVDAGAGAEQVGPSPASPRRLGRANCRRFPFPARMRPSSISPSGADQSAQKAFADGADIDFPGRIAPFADDLAVLNDHDRGGRPRRGEVSGVS
jgi:hypothetical protein